MNTNFNEYVRDIFNSKHALVRSFFHPLSDEEYEQAEIEPWKEKGSPHLLVATSGLREAETNSLYIWFDNITYGSAKCVLARFDLDTFDENKSTPTSACFAPVGVSTAVYQDAAGQRPVVIVIPDYEDSDGKRTVVWSKVIPSDDLVTFPYTPTLTDKCAEISSGKKMVAAIDDLAAYAKKLHRESCLPMGMHKSREINPKHAGFETLYMRAGWYRIGRDQHLSLVISSISIKEDMQNCGLFDSLLHNVDSIARKYGYEFVAVENVLNPVLERHLAKDGFTSNGDTPPVMYRAVPSTRL